MGAPARSLSSPSPPTKNSGSSSAPPPTCARKSTPLRNSARSVQPQRRLHKKILAAPNLPDDSPIGGVFLPSRRRRRHRRPSAPARISDFLHLRHRLAVQRIREKRKQHLQRARPRRPPGSMADSLQQRPPGLPSRRRSRLTRPRSSVSTFRSAALIPTMSATNCAARSRPKKPTRLRIFEREEKASSSPHRSPAGISPEWAKESCRIEAASPFLDGTFWSDDELIKTGRSKKTPATWAISRSPAQMASSNYSLAIQSAAAS